MPSALNGRLGRGGSALASLRLGSLQIASPAYAAVTSVPSAYPQIWAWRNWLLIRPSAPTLACARFFHLLRRLPQRSRRRRAPTSEPIGREATPLLVGAARHSRRSAWLATNRAHRTPLVGAALRADRTTDASERRPYQHNSRLAFTLHKQKPAAFLPRGLFVTP